MKKLLFLFLFFPTFAFADVTRYIDTTCANSGDGTLSTPCASGVGLAGPFNTCASAQILLKVTYALLSTMGVGNLIIDAKGSTVDGQCTIDTIVTDATHLVHFQTSGANRPTVNTVTPVIDTTKYNISCNTNGTGCLQQNILYLELDGIQIDNTGNSTGAYSAYQANSSAALSIKATNSVFHTATCNTGGGGTCDGFFFFPNVANTRYTLWNDVAFGGGSTNFFLRAGGSTNGEIGIVENTGAYGGIRGHRFDGNGASLALTYKNNWDQSNATSGYFVSGSFGTFTHNNNVTQDASSPDVGGRSLTISFTNAGAGNFTLQSGDTAAKGQGADLSGTFTTDLAGATRSVPWDVGPLKYIAATSGLMSHNCTSGSDCRFNFSGGATSGGVQ